MRTWCGSGSISLVCEMGSGLKCCGLFGSWEYRKRIHDGVQAKEWSCMEKMDGEDVVDWPYPL